MLAVGTSTRAAFVKSAQLGIDRRRRRAVASLQILRQAGQVARGVTLAFQPAPLLGREADRPFRRDMDRFGREILDHRCDGPAGPDRDPKLRQEAVGRGLEAVRADHLDLIVLLLQRFDEAVQQPLNPMPHGQPLVGGDQDAQRKTNPSAVTTAWTIANCGAKLRRRTGADVTQARERNAGRCVAIAALF